MRCSHMVSIPFTSSSGLLSSSSQSYFMVHCSNNNLRSIWKCLRPPFYEHLSHSLLPMLFSERINTIICVEKTTRSSSQKNNLKQHYLWACIKQAQSKLLLTLLSNFFEFTTLCVLKVPLMLLHCFSYWHNGVEQNHDLCLQEHRWACLASYCAIF